MNNFLKKASYYIKVFFYPQRCPYCNKVVEHDEIACTTCIQSISSDGYTHGIMDGYRCTSPLKYEGKFKRAIIKYKFKGKTQYTQQFAQLIAKQIDIAYPDMKFDMITYVPMYKKDYKNRGYNQSQLLAQAVSELTKIPYVDTLIKKKQTKPQHTLPAQKRKTNLYGAFSLIDKSRVKGKTILLLDDIVTTGRTLHECAKVLQRGKPNLVCCITLLTVQN